MNTTQTSAKKALLVVSFGTSYSETREKTIGAIEREAAAAFPDRQVRRAFTSSMILRVLARRDGLHIDNVTQAMGRLIADGFTDVLVQPTHIINGEEYEKMKAQIRPFAACFSSLRIGAPLLSSSEDYTCVVNAIAAEVLRLYPTASLCCLRGADADAAGDMPALVLMGHGTEHHVDAAYAALDYRFKDMGYPRAIVGTVEGYPAFAQVEKQLEALNPAPETVLLMPFMIVAGDHARNDMAGEEEDSWNTMLRAKGYRTECILKGLGEMEAIRAVFLKHMQQALAEESEPGHE